MKDWRALLGLLLLCPFPARSEEAAPFERTEDREPCAHYTETRHPFFGQLHLHTQYSADAATLDTRNTPFDAYRFARGEKVGLAPFFDTRPVQVDESEPPVNGVSTHSYCLPPEHCQYTASRTIRLPEGRELDFAAVTDHSEFLGQTNICYFEGGADCTSDSDCGPGEGCNRGSGTCVPNGYDSPTCAALRASPNRLVAGAGGGLVLKVWFSEFPQAYPMCNLPGANGENTCAFQTKNVWQQTIAAAEEAYDRTDQCRFTSFIGYEYTSSPTMGQCQQTGSPCFDDADCGEGDSCAPLGQCGDPVGNLCYSDAACAEGSSCVPLGGGNNLHRNIIFRNANVPDAPISYIEAPTGCGSGGSCLQYTGSSGTFPAGAFSTAGGVALGSPTVMLQALEKECHPGQEKPCEFLSIPHNSNLSGGAMFVVPESPTDARVRSEHERLVEIFQIKGSSECRYSDKHPGDWFTADELCGFENMSFGTLAGTYVVDPDARSVPPAGYVRNALEQGLAYRKENPEVGVNPFQLGFAGSLDNHNGTPTATEVDYSKVGAHGDNSFAANGQMMNETNFLGLETNGGGLTAVWAEENSRDSLFAGMQRRETYATSGTRPTVRFFGGFDLPSGICEEGDFAKEGYEHGVPMGGTFTAPDDTAADKAGAPRFAVSALMDPGWEGHPGATLERAQIVKGWVDEDGEVHEKVYDVAGGASAASPVDLDTCTPGEKGLRRLCSVWEDPDFDASEHAFYYARVLENPSCRWNRYYCLDRQVDCSKPPETGRDLVGYNAYEYAQCCGTKVPKAVQQRAWTSPIWYVP